MIGGLIKSISKAFGGNKTDRDLREVTPIVDAVNQHFQSYTALSNDELRNKTNEFIERINAYLSSIDQEIADAKQHLADTQEYETDVRDGIFHQLDELEKSRDAKLEEILDELLPEAFAVVKATAQRFTDNEKLEVTATDLDRELAVTHKNIVVEGNKAVYANEWMAAG
ncbi:MAG: preprotein translocase subunit SecA, partial [Bacteroidia bacterium]|nr:preprotein translocase subunit SecA [Bacteroidia bacterium]